MSSDSNSETMTHEERVRLRRQLGEQAVKLAVSNRWDEAAAANREVLKLFGDDADAWNRLGKALSEINQIEDARAAYQRALELDPTNTIAKRNFDRLASQQAAGGGARSTLDTRLFLQESGKAAVATLQAVDSRQSARLDPGDVVGLDVQGNAVNVVTPDGDYIGMVEPRIGLRLSRLAAGGNRYSAALISTTGEVKVMLRESYQHPSQAELVSFPHSRGSDFRAYTRRGLLRGDDIDLGDDEDDEEDNDSWTDESDEAESAGMSIQVDTEDEGFD
ncbi:MAG: tetratricopeptide repeat protein [Dehalococcoidia bacterium]